MAASTLRPPLTAAPLEVWAVEDTSLQITWGRLPPGAVQAAVGGRASTIEHEGGPGSIVVDGLRPDSPVEIEMSWSEPDGGRRRAARRSLSTRTVASPPGPELFRFATISDLHIGAQRWGFLKTMGEAGEHAGGPHPERCARAAITEAVHWGAELIVIKGDAVHHRHPDNFAALGRLIDEFPDVDMLLLPGNHDVDSVTDIDLPALGRRGLTYRTGVTVRDLPGVRLVGADTTKPGAGDGTLATVGDDIVEAVAEGHGPAFVVFHHHLERFEVLTHWPPGIDKHEADRLVDGLSRTGQSVLISSGHSHRNRARALGAATFTEVASTKDWPGVWAGYSVHEGGLRQVVRRIAAPDTVDWHEYSRGAVLGLWSPWAAGRQTDRSVVTKH